MKKSNQHTYQKQYEKIKRHIRWTSKTQHIDIETGQVLTKHTIQHEQYIHISTEKDYTINQTKTTGHIEYIKLYKRNPQLKLL